MARADVKRVPEDSPEECLITRSNSYGPTDSSQPHGDTSEIPFKADNVDSALAVESPSSHDVVEDALIILSGDPLHSLFLVPLSRLRKIDSEGRLYTHKSV